MNADTPLTVSDGVNIGAGDAWQLRFPGVTTNMLSKVDDYFTITLDSTANENAAFWARNILTAYIGKTVKIKFSMKRNGDASAAVCLIIGGTTGRKIIAPTVDWTDYDYDMIVESQYADNRVMFYAASGLIANICLRNVSITFKSDLVQVLDGFNQRISTLEIITIIMNNVLSKYPNIMLNTVKHIREDGGYEYRNVR